MISVSRLQALLVVAVFTLLSSTGLAAPPIPVDESNTAEVVLRRVFEPGAEARYQAVLDIERQLLSMTPAWEQEGSIRLQAGLRSLVQEVDTDGNGFMALEVLEPRITARVDGEEVSTRDAIRAWSGVVGRSKLSPQGEILDRETLASLGDPTGFEALSFSAATVLDPFAYPEQAVSPGDSWEAVSEIVQLGSTHRAQSVFTFLGHAQIGDDTVALVEGEHSTWIELGDGQRFYGMSGPALGRRIARGYYYLNTSTGLSVQEHVSFGIAMRTTERDDPIDLTLTGTFSLDSVSTAR